MRYVGTHADVGAAGELREASARIEREYVTASIWRDNVKKPAQWKQGNFIIVPNQCWACALSPQATTNMSSHDLGRWWWNWCSDDVMCIHFRYLASVFIWLDPTRIVEHPFTILKLNLNRIHTKFFSESTRGIEYKVMKKWIRLINSIYVLLFKTPGFVP